MKNFLLKLTKKLVRIKSITPNDKGCQNIISKILIKLNFNVEFFNYKNTKNLWAYKGSGKKTLLFLGHTDVVDANNLNLWKYPPFSATIKNSKIYGRGVLDMKGAISSMIIAINRFIKSGKKYRGRIALLLTSDEEGNGKNGIKKVLKKLKKRNEKIDYCIVGEPTSKKKICDTIKNGRRGSLTFKIHTYFKSLHVAYCNKNPILLIIKVINEILSFNWNKKKSLILPYNSVQLTKIYSLSNSLNSTPNNINFYINFRFNDTLKITYIKNEIKNIIEYHKIKFKIKFFIYGKPFYTKKNCNLIKKISKVIEKNLKFKPKISTEGGTSDGRYISEICDQVIELGLLNNKIHCENEFAKISDLEKLTNIYEKILYEVIT
ncbi:MAG: succinyl-diaminopimelate desuccinylase [Enterobacteriaceae bacterium]